MAKIWNPFGDYTVGEEVLIPTKAKGKVKEGHVLLMGIVRGVLRDKVVFDCPQAWKPTITMARANLLWEAPARDQGESKRFVAQDYAKDWASFTQSL